MRIAFSTTNFTLERVLFINSLNYKNLLFKSKTLSLDNFNFTTKLKNKKIIL